MAVDGRDVGVFVVPSCLDSTMVRGDDDVEVKKSRVLGLQFEEKALLIEGNVVLI